MKIALVIQNADRRSGGAEGYTLDLAKALAARGHDVTVVAERSPAAAADEGYRFAYLGAQGLIRWARIKDFVRRVDALYAAGTFDVVHAMLPVRRCDVYQPHAGLAADMLATGHLKHPNTVKQTLSRLANRLNLKRIGLARIERTLMARRPWLLCSSSTMRDFARRAYALPDDHLVPMMNGIDLHYFTPPPPAHAAAARRAIREEWKIEDRHCLGLLVGNNWKLKGVPEAIDAVARAKDPRLVLMIVGKEEGAAYRKQAERLGVRDQIRFVGRVKDLRTVYGAADFFVLPTRRDTCSLVVLEALAMGLPVITTLQNGASDVVDDGRQGLLLDRGNPATLAAAFHTMLDDARRSAMAREALAMRFTLSHEHHVDKIEAVYHQVAAARRTPEPARV
jgi:UDP-glucose:(heptosyl)LPS alpha-1,3-glucosyltransferase